MSALHTDLMNGIENIKSRDDGSVHTIHLAADGKTVVAEVCVGKKRTRLNFKDKVEFAPEGFLSGRSKSWVGGGIVLTTDNLAPARELLLQVVGLEPMAEVKVEDAAKLQAEAKDAVIEAAAKVESTPRRRTRSSRSTAKK